MAIALATISTDLWDTLYNHLQTGTYAITTNNIFSAFNDKLIADVGLPIVVIQPPDISLKSNNMNSSITIAEVSYIIEIYHKTAADLKTVTEEVINKIRTGYNVFALVNLKRTRDDWFKTIGYDSWQTAPNHRIHKYVMEVSFRYTG